MVASTVAYPAATPSPTGYPGVGWCWPGRSLVRSTDGFEEQEASKRMVYDGLTDNQCQLLTLLVEELESGNYSRKFWVNATSENEWSLILRSIGRKVKQLRGLEVSDLDALAEKDYITLSSTITGNYIGTLKIKAYLLYNKLLKLPLREGEMSEMQRFQQGILEAIAEKPLWNTEIAERLGLDPEQVRDHLLIMEAEGYVKLLKSQNVSDVRAELAPRGRVKLPFPDSEQRQASVQLIISQSTIGVLNAGEIENVETISVNVSSLVGSGHPGIAQALEALTNAVTESHEISSDERAEILQQLEELSKQATLAPEKRKFGIIKPILTSLAGMLQAAGGFSEVWATWGPTIQAFFASFPL
jgi:predicted ArsR family transcriptional regulator